MQHCIPSKCVHDYDEYLVRVPLFQDLNQVNQLKLTFIYEQTVTHWNVS